MIPLCMTEVLSTQDFTIINGALRGISEQFSVAPTQLHWPLSAQMLTIGALLVPSGVAAVRFGPKWVFVLGLMIGGAGNLLAFAAGSFLGLVMARVISGIGLSLVLSIVLLLIAELFPEDAARDRALAVVAVAQLVGLPVGALAGGMLMAAHGWHWGFLLNAVVALATIPCAWLVLPVTQTPRRHIPATLDVRGLLLIAALSAFVVWTVSRISQQVLRDLGSDCGVLLCALSGALLIRAERRAAHPIVPAGIVKAPSFLRAWALIALITCLNTGLVFISSLHLHQLARSANEVTLLLFGPMALGSVLGIWLIRPLVAASSRSTAVLAGLTIDTLLLLLFAARAPAAFGALPAVMVAVAASMLMIFVPAQTEALAEASLEERGIISSLLRMAYNLPTGIGIAAVAGTLAIGGERGALFMTASFGLAGLLLWASTRGDWRR